MLAVVPAKDHAGQASAQAVVCVPAIDVREAVQKRQELYSHNEGDDVL